jgi:hypothetical protein
MFDLTQWAAQWHIPAAALQDLQRRIGLIPEAEQLPDLLRGTSEAAVSADAVHQARQNHGAYVWRNNSGGFTDEHGNHVRYGLGNISAQVNAVMKTPDYVGIRPLLIQQHHVGQVLGQFWGIEMKAAGWKYSAADARARAQWNYGQLVLRLGGRWQFHSGGVLA